LPRQITFFELKERGHHFQNLESPGSHKTIYLSGYWQSEKYFDDVSGIIREEFQLKNEPAGLNLELVRAMRGSQAVSLHVRRGDYVSNPIAASYHGVCSLEYYRTAIKLIEEKVANPKFYVFSDDIPWCKENLRFPQPATYVDHNSDEPFEDLRLMSFCKHFIIANSSFSWWGAWLSRNQEKIVLAPKKWFLTREKDDRDQVPANWIRI